MLVFSVYITGASNFKKVDSLHINVREHRLNLESVYVRYPNLTCSRAYRQESIPNKSATSKAALTIVIKVWQVVFDGPRSPSSDAQTLTSSSPLS
jgi:hypothetical protein